ncbi:MAG: ATP synthase F1 subunit epsilon [Candidatus Pacebacteria bacterium]|nr:ATP synthase F1 subunit epsilon [Candidatus Paceibacterota bacterium]
MKKLGLKVISQEKEILSRQVDGVSVPAEQGTMTILPEHIALFARTQTGELTYQFEEKKASMLVTDGFVHVSPDNQVTVIVDEAVEARNISLVKAQEAVEAAQKTMSLSRDEKELMMAEASLKRALLEVRIARKSKKRQV